MNSVFLHKNVTILENNTWDEPMGIIFHWGSVGSIKSSSFNLSGGRAITFENSAIQDKISIQDSNFTNLKAI